jgi:nitrogen fixation protein NifU and related proteins
MGKKGLFDEETRQIIYEHYQHPTHKRKPEENELSNYKSIRMESTSCIDDITIYLKVDNGIVVDALFDGIACTISISSTDIMCDLILNKPIKEVEQLISEYMNMIKEEECNLDSLGEAKAFIVMPKQPARVKCATIGWDGLKKILEEYK